MQIEFDGCVAAREGETLLIFYGNLVEDWYPESGPQMTTWDTNTGRNDIASDIDASAFYSGDAVHVVATIQPYKEGTYMYSIRLESIARR